jgi:hypothetical protein
MAKQDDFVHFNIPFLWGEAGEQPDHHGWLRGTPDDL